MVSGTAALQYSTQHANDWCWKKPIPLQFIAMQIGTNLFSMLATQNARSFPKQPLMVTSLPAVDCC